MEEAYLQGYQAGATACGCAGWEGRLDMDLITLGHGGEGRREQDGDTILK